MNLSEKDCIGYNKIWKEILKTKVKIIFDISRQKNINFLELLEELFPIANQPEFKNIWIDSYINRI